MRDEPKAGVNKDMKVRRNLEWIATKARFFVRKKIISGIRLRKFNTIQKLKRFSRNWCQLVGVMVCGIRWGIQQQKHSGGVGGAVREGECAGFKQRAVGGDAEAGAVVAGDRQPACLAGIHARSQRAVCEIGDSSIGDAEPGEGVETGWE